jgi:hypothetical protein
LYWECTSLQASESFPFGTTNTDDVLEEGPPFKAVNLFSLAIALDEIALKGNKRSSVRREQSLTATFEVWGKAVKAFSSAALTYETDKLVAISAILREMKPFMRCRYLAGHWEPDLIFQLTRSASLNAIPTRQKKYVHHHGPGRPSTTRLLLSKGCTMTWL